MDWAAAIAAIVGLLGIILKAWLNRRSKQEKTLDELKQELRAAIASGDDDAVAAAIDKLRQKARDLRTE